MPVEVAPPKTTGGGGFGFEDKVCAYWMAHLISGAPPLSPTDGQLDALHFQTRPDGWYLDDVVLTLRRGSDRTRAAASVRSNVQFGASSAPADFVRAVWEQYLHIGSDAFAPESDLLILVTAPLPHTLRMGVDSLQQKLEGADPDNFAARLAVPGWANELERALFESFRCPPSVSASTVPTDQSTTRLLKRVRLLEFDFERPVSAAEQRAVELCRGMLASGELQEALRLWDRLLRVAAKHRPVAGHVARFSLISELRKDFGLKVAPEYGRDWEQLTASAATASGRVPDAVGGTARVDRAQEVARLDHALGKSSVAILGESGAGKSAMARRCAEAHQRNGEVYLWFDGQSFDRRDFAEFEGDLRLRHDLGELAALCPGKSPVVFLDGLDRLFRPESFSLVSSVLRTLNAGESESPWRVVVTCQTQEWRRIEESLRRAGVECAAWSVETINHPSMEDLAPVFERFPPLRGLLRDPKLTPLLRNLKVLDVLATRVSLGNAVNLGTWVGESSAAEWFWNSFVVDRPDGHQRAHFLTKMAEVQADQLSSATPRDSFESSDLATLRALEQDRICRVVNEKVAFEHDLLSDWSRLRLLLAHSDELHRYMQPRVTSPLWHRAVRLYAMHLLEHGDLAAWRSHVSATGETEEALGDLFLDAAFLTANAFAVLESLHGDLTANDGRLLGRLLARFQVLATRPDPRLAALMRAEGLEVPVSVRFRSPNWSYWPGLLRYLHRHATALAALAPLDLASLTMVWLENAPPKVILRKEAAEIALRLGTWALDNTDAFGLYNAQNTIFRAVLSAASEYPDETSTLLMRAVGRSPDQGADEKETRRLERRTLFMSPEQSAQQWPNGPRRRIAHGIREAILETGALTPLIQVRPAIAREVVLAALLEAPSERSSRSDGFAAMHLGFSSGIHWIPAFYTDGPFLLFLRTSFGEGLELIADVVDFASERWCSGEDDLDPSGVAAAQHRQAPEVAVPLASGVRSYLGDNYVYGWSAGVGNAPDPVQASLMALEQYFYQRIEQGEQIEDQLLQVLERVRSAAFLKVLIEIGKREKNLFRRGLLPLLGVAEIYHWDIAVSIHGRRAFGIGAPLRGDWFLKLASAFHGAAHRKEDLRHVLTKVLLDYPETRPFLAARAAEWEASARSEPNSDEGQFLQQLANLARFENYRAANRDESGVLVVNVKEAERVSAMAPELARQMRDTELMQLPMRCRDVIDNGKKLAPTDVDKLWELISSIPARPTPESDSATPRTRRSLSFVGRLVAWIRAVFSRRQEPKVAGEAPPTTPPDHDELNLLPAAVAGGIAVLVRLHPEWLEKFPDRKQWCLERLRDLIETPPPGAVWDMPTSASDWTWDSFAGEAVPLLWAERPADPMLLGLAGRLVFAPHNEAVRTLFTRCSEQRVNLGEHFERLRRLLFEWASIRPVAYRARELVHSPEASRRAARVGRRILKWKNTRVREFVRGRMEGVTTPWSTMDVGKSLRVDLGIPTWAWEPFDLDLVRAAHEWVPPSEAISDASERQTWTAFWLDALADVLPRRTRLIGRDETPRDDFPFENECWLLSRVANALLSLDGDSEPLLRTVLELPRHAHKWTAEFLRSYHRDALRRSVIPKKYAATTASIVEFAAARVGGGPERDPWPPYEDVWEALLGVDAFTQHCWEKRHERVVAETLGTFERWASLRWTVVSHIQAFSTWLARDAAVPLRFQALVWMQRTLRNSNGEWLLDRDGQGAEALSAFLATVWQRDEARLRSAREPFAAFRDLLTALATHQNVIAIELLARVGAPAP